jgi:hypothetical protein
MDTQDLLIQAAQNEVKLASTFPLTLLPQLKLATEIDLQLAEKSKEIEIGPLTEEEKKLKRNALAKTKEYASRYLTDTSTLEKIKNDIKLLGKKSKAKKAKKSKRAKKRKSVRFA